jgi:hypothetical protein
VPDEGSQVQRGVSLSLGCIAQPLKH